MIDRRGAQTALKAFADPDHTVDHTLFDLRYSRTARRLRPMQIVPAIGRRRVESGTDQKRDRFDWKRLERMTEILWPRASIRHPWPNQRFAVNHPR